MDRLQMTVSAWDEPNGYSHEELEEFRRAVRESCDARIGNELHEEGGPFGFDGALLLHFILSGAGTGAALFAAEAIKTLAKKAVDWLCDHMKRTPERTEAPSDLDIQISPPADTASDRVLPAFKFWVYPALPISPENRRDPATLTAQVQHELISVHEAAARIWNDIEQGRLPATVHKAELHRARQGSVQPAVVLLTDAGEYTTELNARGQLVWSLKV